MFSAPLRSERKTICLPSRDQRGWESNAGPEVIRVAVPPAMGMVYRSPTSSNTMVLPSGETSRDIQVPSDVENDTVRVVLSGRSPFFLPVSARARTSGEAARAGAGVGWTGTSRAARVTARIRCIEAPKRGGRRRGKTEGVDERRQGKPSSNTAFAPRLRKPLAGLDRNRTSCDVWFRAKGLRHGAGVERTRPLQDLGIAYGPVRVSGSCVRRSTAAGPPGHNTSGVTPVWHASPVP